MSFVLAKIGALVGFIVGFMHSDNIYSGAGALGFAIGWSIFLALIGLVLDFVLRVINKKPNSETHVKCPDCRELVLCDARKCKHCGCNLIPQ